MMHNHSQWSGIRYSHPPLWLDHHALRRSGAAIVSCSHWRRYSACSASIPWIGKLQNTSILLHC